ncbi:hypothetical protein [Streptomyces lasiicapitis]|uniref:hypothetical protein n=1 Tax=Streptomyces lasiicapitis TaxID=1923961 RepID=UPI0036A04CA6
MNADEGGGEGGAADGISGPPREPARRSRIAELADTTIPAAAEPVSQGRPPDPEANNAEHAARRRREFAALLGEFRRAPVLLPLDEHDASPLTAEFNGVRWIYVFSDEAALARFAVLRDEAARPWDYQRLLGARLLDGVIPALGVPCGVALDVGSEGHEALFPPVTGIVPDAVAVDIDTNGETRG